jgi:hypothetical protein
VNHDHCVVFLRLRDSTDSNVAIPNGFDFETPRRFASASNAPNTVSSSKNNGPLDVSEGREREKKKRL